MISIEEIIGALNEEIPDIGTPILSGKNNLTRSVIEHNLDPCIVRWNSGSKTSMIHTTWIEEAYERAVAEGPCDCPLCITPELKAQMLIEDEIKAAQNEILLADQELWKIQNSNLVKVNGHWFHKDSDDFKSLGSKKSLLRRLFSR